MSSYLITLEEVNSKWFATSADFPGYYSYNDDPELAIKSLINEINLHLTAIKEDLEVIAEA